jgi:hypothetical protein
MRKEDWLERCRHLADGRGYLEQARADKSQRHLLDRAVWCAWTFGEFAVNVCLELVEAKLETHHNQAVRAQDLFAKGILQRDYSKTIQKLEQYRLRADYTIYSRGPSIHYSPKNVSDCLEDMEHLRDELEAILERKGRL